jgi:hypothetical protein
LESKNELIQESALKKYDNEKEFQFGNMLGWDGLGWGAEYTSVRDLIFPLFMKFLNFNFNLSRERTVVSVHLIV